MFLCCVFPCLRDPHSVVFASASTPLVVSPQQWDPATPSPRRPPPPSVPSSSPPSHLTAAARAAALVPAPPHLQGPAYLQSLCQSASPLPAAVVVARLHIELHGTGGLAALPLTAGSGALAPFLNALYQPWGAAHEVPCAGAATAEPRAQAAGAGADGSASAVSSSTVALSASAGAGVSAGDGSGSSGPVAVITYSARAQAMLQARDMIGRAGFAAAALSDTTYSRIPSPSPSSTPPSYVPLQIGRAHV